MEIKQLESILAVFEKDGFSQATTCDHFDGLKPQVNRATGDEIKIIISSPSRPKQCR